VWCSKGYRCLIGWHDEFDAKKKTKSCLHCFLRYLAFAAISFCVSLNHVTARSTESRSCGFWAAGGGICFAKLNPMTAMMHDIYKQSHSAVSSVFNNATDFPLESYRLRAKRGASSFCFGCNFLAKNYNERISQIVQRLSTTIVTL